MISIVCVYNDEEILRDCLLKSLDDQTAEFELIKIDNTPSIYKSAAEALNYGGKKARGKYIMFVHQDVDLCSRTWLEDTEEILKSIPDLGIAGVVGMSEEGKKQNVIKQGIPPVWLPHIPIQKPKRGQTVDECLVIIPKAIFDMLPFDETVCDDWHLYTVDYCLSLKERDRGVYIIPVLIHHIFKYGSKRHKSPASRIKDYFQTIFSLGSLPQGYYQTLPKVLKKHKKYFKRICTTSGIWSTSYPLILQRITILIKEALRYILIKIGVRYLWKKYLKGKIFKGQGRVWRSY